MNYNDFTFSFFSKTHTNNNKPSTTIQLISQQHDGSAPLLDQKLIDFNEERKNSYEKHDDKNNELVWVPTWANPADAPSLSKPIESWYASLPKLPPAPTAVLASAHALSELELLRDPRSVAAHTAGEHVRELESSGAFSCLKSKPVYVENAPSQVTYAGESSSTPRDMRHLTRKGGKNEWKDEKADGAADSSTSHWPRHDPIFVAPSWYTAPPGLGLPTEAGLENWRNELLYREGEHRKTSWTQTHTFLRGRDVQMQDVLHTSAPHFEVAAQYGVVRPNLVNCILTIPYCRSDHHGSCTNAAWS